MLEPPSGMAQDRWALFPKVQGDADYKKITFFENRRTSLDVKR